MTTIATVYVPDERYQAQRPDHIHRRCQTNEEAQGWIEAVAIRLGNRGQQTRAELFDWNDGYRCPRCGWTVL